jgi:predicted MarR family transcription regulator
MKAIKSQEPASENLKRSGKGPLLVASSELVVEGNESSSEFEFGLIVTWNAFSRWVSRGMAAAGGAELSLVESILLTHVCHRGREKKLADICFTLNIADTHVVSYGLRKLVSLDLIDAKKVGKEVFYSATKKGEALVQRYKEIRQTCLIPSLDGEIGDRLEKSAEVLRQMSGNYDQAARSAASL